MRGNCCICFLQLQLMWVSKCGSKTLTVNIMNSIHTVKTHLMLCRPESVSSVSLFGRSCGCQCHTLIKYFSCVNVNAFP